VCIDAGPDGGTPERQLGEVVHYAFEPFDPDFDLGRKAGELLTQPHRRGIHQVSAPRLHDVIELTRLCQQ
jgi:hypothetical protein